MKHLGLPKQFECSMVKMGMKFRRLIHIQEISMGALRKLGMFLSKKETPVTSGCEFWSQLTQRI